MKNECYYLATNWNTNCMLDKDDGQGNIPREIKSMGNHYEIFFTHNLFTVKVYSVAYAKYGDWQVLKPKEPTVLELVRGG